MSAVASVAQPAPVVCVEKVIGATPGQVFAAWTQPEHLLRWWGQTDQHNVIDRIARLY